MQNFKEIIEKLKNIDVDDIKNIDVQKIKEYFLSRPDIYINILMICLTIFIMVKVHTKSYADSKILKTELSEKKEKLNVLRQTEAIQNEYNEFFANFPAAVSSNQLIDNISILALKRDIQIKSFSPAQEIADQYLMLTSMKFNISSSSYANIILFLRDLENSQKGIRLEKFNAQTSLSHIKRSTQDVREDVIEANIEIASFRLKNEKL